MNSSRKCVNCQKTPPLLLRSSLVLRVFRLWPESVSHSESGRVEGRALRYKMFHVFLFFIAPFGREWVRLILLSGRQTCGLTPELFWSECVCSYTTRSRRPGHCFQTLKITYDYVTDKWPACGRLNRDGFLSGTEAGTCGTLLRNRFDCSRTERPENSPTLKLHVRERSDGLFRNEKEMILSQVTVVCVKHAMPTERIWHPVIKKNT